MKVTGLMIVMLMVTSLVYAGGPGTTRGEYLKLEQSARVMALGSSLAGTLNAPEATNLNPAAACVTGDGLYQAQVQLSHNEWPMGVRGEDLRVTTSEGIIGMQYQYYGYGKMQSYDASGKAIDVQDLMSGRFALNSAFGILKGQGYRVIAGCRIGITQIAGGVLDNISPDFGIGTIYIFEIWNRDVSFGASYEYPTNTKNFGVSLPIIDNLTATLATKIDWKTEFRAGIECSVWEKPRVLIRGGYRNSQIAAFACGGGIQLANWNLDYAFAPLKADFGNNHLVTLSAKF